MILHAGCLALFHAGGWRGVLVTGPSGAGKSDLALRLLDADFRLVADDRTVVWTSGGSLFARCPQVLTGLIEARGLGVTPESFVRMTEVVFVVRCAPDPSMIERSPDPQTETLCGHALPAIDLFPLEASAPAKVRRALTSLGAGRQQAYLARRDEDRARDRAPVRGLV